MTGAVLTIVGPTCTGKTSLALELCKRFNGAIISADSRQVVRYMDIGTGKLPAEESLSQLIKLEHAWNVSGISLYGYDLIDPDAYFSAYDFVQYCQKILPRISHEGKNSFLVGGTGFYIDAVTGRALLNGVGPDLELRKGLENLPTEELAKRLFKLDETSFKKIDLKNPVRLIRAIEKASQTKFSHKVSAKIENLTFIGLMAERKVLYERADKWVDKIFNEKLFDETRQVYNRFPTSHRLRGLIYKSVMAYLNGALTLEESKQQAKYDVHAYIRRQQTWFKRNKTITWFDISQKNFDGEVFSRVESLLNG